MAPAVPPSSSGGGRFLDMVERVGNRLPDAVTLFFVLLLLTILVSVLASALGASVIHPAKGTDVPVVSLLSPEIIRRWLVEMPTIFASFPPLATVLLAMLGVGLAERTGLLGVALGGFVRSMPARALTPAVVFAGVMANLAADAGYVVLVPLAAALFASAGRHPIAGLAAGFAGVSGGFSANLVLTPLDALLAGISQPAAQIIAPGYTVGIESNYFVFAAMVPLLVVVGTYVSDRIIEPRLGPWQGGSGADEIGALTPAERRGLSRAGLVTLVMLVAALAMVLPENGILRGEGGSLQPFFQSLVSLLAVTAAAAAIAYGLAAGSVKTDKDAVRLTSEAMRDLGYYIVLVFGISQFIALFNWSNLGLFVAVNGADGLESIGFSGVPLVVGFIILTCIINLLIGSASAKWALLAPIFVPIFMQLGYTPEYAQATYRVGDSFTNIISPLNPYFPLVIVFAQRYVKDFGIGSLVSVMLPFSIAFGIFTTLLFVLWTLLGLPVGPGAEIYFTPAGAGG